MTTVSTKYVVDSRGRKKAVLMNIKDYSKLVNYLEQLEDALDLDKAVHNAREFREYRLVREELNRKGRL